MVTDMNSQPTLGEKSFRWDGRWQRHQNENDEGIRWKHGHAPILRSRKRISVVGEKLMMIERVPLIDRAQAFMLTGRWIMYLCTAHSNTFVKRKASGTVSHSIHDTL